MSWLLFNVLFFNYLSWHFGTTWSETCQSAHARGSEANPRMPAPIWETDPDVEAPALCGSVEPEIETIEKNSWCFYSIKFENRKCLFFYCMWTCEYRKISFQRDTFKQKVKTGKYVSSPLSWNLCEIKDFSCVYMCLSYELLGRVSDWYLCKACLMLRGNISFFFFFFKLAPLVAIIIFC